MFTSHLRGHQRHSQLRNEELEDENERPSSRQSASQQRRRAAQQQQHQQYQERHSARVPPIQHHSYYKRDEPLLDEDDDEPIDEEQDWRQAAQMLTERDEMLLLAGSRFGPDTTDVAPVNRRRLQQQMQRRSQSPSSSQQNRSPTPQSGGKKASASNKSASQLASRMLFTSASSQKKVTPAKRVEEEPTDFNDLDQDDNSSISFAQSGCQSILSAWRLKAANRKRQREHQQARPTSVLSNSSSVGKKSAASTAYTLASRLTAGGGKSPAAQTRIPLGPKSAQHFVTNSRRRRRANELILNTLEARRRALSLNRQQNLLLGAGGSLFGSESYLLAGAEPNEQLRGATPEHLLADYQRLSLSPSPSAARSPSPLVAAMSQRRPVGSGALSDLGGRQSALVRKVQANKLQNTPAAGAAKSRSQSSLNRAPPLAKLDQNSSDLCSSNDSSSGESSSSSSSSSSGESRFTQLVTSELAPVERALMAGPTGANPAAIRSRYLPAEPSRSPSRPGAGVESPSKRAARIPRATPTPPLPSAVELPPPKPPARTRKKQQQQPEDLSASKRQMRTEVRRTQERQMVSSDEEDDDGAGSRLRRGALKRDSIRRLRMSRQSSNIKTTSSSSSRDEAGDSPKTSKYQRQPMPLDPTTPNKQMQPLSKSRKLDIETNPFLNRHHFRTLSQRSTESGRQSAQARRPATPNQLRSSQRSARAATSRPIEEEAPEVRRVEQMLRQMKPGQVLEARSQEREFSRSDAMDSKTVDSRDSRRPAARQDDLVIRSSPTKHLSQQQPQERTRKEVPKTATASQERESSGRNEFKTTTRLVREGARSTDDAKLDLMGNKRVSELTTERWRLEKREHAPERRPDGSLVWGSSQLATSERVERVQSASISPPPEFSDRRQRGGDIERASVAPSARTLTSRQLISGTSQPALPPKPPSRSGLTTATPRSTFSPPPPPPTRTPTLTSSMATEERALEKQMRRAVSEERAAGAAGRSAREWTSGAKKTGATQAGGRQTSERATTSLAAYQRPLSSQFLSESSASSSARAKEPQRSVGAAASTGRRQEIDPIGARMLQTDLPKFERTADDEFRKRVDQLRQLARANLHTSELEDRAARGSKILGEQKIAATKRPISSELTRGASSTIGTTTTTSSRFLSEQKPATLKPLSLNWSGPKDERSKEPQVVSRASNLRASEMSRTRPTVASTNLDDMLLADRYQRPLPVGAWRRSNSSLASLSSARPAQRPTSPFASRFGDAPKSTDSVLSHSAMSIGPREPSDAAELVPMRVVVKEKSAPKRDFAFVEQRAPVQRLELRNTAEVAVSRPTELQRQRPQTPPRQQQQQQQEQTVTAQRSTSAANRPSVTSQQTASSSQQARQELLARSRLVGATSPRSPEFGATANSSSNEDSAIASSVSSPSLSFSMNPSGLQSISEQRHSLATSRPVSTTTPTTTSIQRPSAASTPTIQSQLTGLRVAAPLEQKSQAQTGGALQSILRRQQQLRRQQEERVEVSGEQRDSQPATPSQAAGSYLVPLSSTSYTHTTQTSISKTTTTLTREPLDGSVASVNVQPSELRQFRDSQTSLHVREAPQQASIQEQQQPPVIAPVPTNQKRVHFNDRTSVRSFESLSSENSNSTAINNGAQGQLTAEQQRQLIGSPDSMGSGSTSRLSCDSPDFRRVGSGGAIYAIRGDPELEQSPVNMMINQQQQQQQLFGGIRQPLGTSQQQALRYQQQTIPMQLPRPVQHPVAVSIAQQQFNQRQQQAQMQQQQQQQLSPQSLGSPTGRIRMTAPPVINTAGAAYSSQMMVSPRAGQPMLASPVMTALPNQLPSPMMNQHQQVPLVGRPSFLDEEEDPNYAFRLRQAAANRAFNFIQQQQQPQPAPSNLNRSGPTSSSGGGGGGGTQAQRRQPIDLVNFQTEV